MRRERCWGERKGRSVAVTFFSRRLAERAGWQPQRGGRRRPGRRAGRSGDGPLAQSGKAGGIVGELFSPELLLLLKLRVDFLKSLPSRRNGLARLGTKTEEHRPASLT